MSVDQIAVLLSEIVKVVMEAAQYVLAHEAAFQALAAAIGEALSGKNLPEALIAILHALAGLGIALA